MEKRCECCGNTFNARKKTARFCSRACRNNALGSPQLYRCDYCGKEFKVSSTKIKELASGKRKHLCCSKSCFDNIQVHSFDDVKELFDRRGYPVNPDAEEPEIHVWQSGQDTNTWAPGTINIKWTDLGTVEEVQGGT